ncbi:hypothetical protein FRC03_010837 [Tulasnella sp. 419]|nr:hypothetical protein FRC03_010837 [Tulasnella sp. 419]
MNVQNTEGKVPDMEQRHTSTSTSSTVRHARSNALLTSKDKGLDSTLGSPRLWEGDTQDIQFLKSQSVCNPRLIGVENWVNVVSATLGVLLFTLPSEVIMYYTERKTFRRINYGFRVKSTSAAHNLSPDGNTLVRWIVNENDQSRAL